MLSCWLACLCVTSRDSDPHWIVSQRVYWEPRWCPLTDFFNLGKAAALCLEYTYTGLQVWSHSLDWISDWHRNYLLNKTFGINLSTKQRIMAAPTCTNMILTLTEYYLDPKFTSVKTDELYLNNKIAVLISNGLSAYGYMCIARDWDVTVRNHTAGFLFGWRSIPQY